MDYKGIAEQILKDVGGPENIASYAHCATRLRLVLVDETKADKKAVEKIEAVAGSFTAGGQYQIILGPGTVNKVHDELAALTHIKEASMEEVKKAAAAHMNPVQRFVKTLSDIFVPLIPALVASGLMMGLYNLLAQQGLWPWLADDENLIGQWPAIADLAAIIIMFANAAFVFLPVLIGFSAAKVFGANQYLGAVIGMIMVHPALLNAWGQGQAALEGNIPTWSLFGWEVAQIGYQGTVLPVLFAVYFLAIVEKWLHKRMPTVLDMLFTPLFAVIATGFATILVIGPVMRWVGDADLGLLRQPARLRRTRGRVHHGRDLLAAGDHRGAPLVPRRRAGPAGRHRRQPAAADLVDVQRRPGWCRAGGVLPDPPPGDEDQGHRDPVGRVGLPRNHRTGHLRCEPEVC